MARRLRVDGKKTYPEIAAILDVKTETLKTWGRQEKWPDPAKERTDLKKIVQSHTRVSKSSAPDQQPPLAPQEKTPAANSFTMSESLILDGDSIPTIAEKILRWSMQVVSRSAELSPSMALKLGELAAKIWLATSGSQPVDIRVMREISVPVVSETFRDPPPAPAVDPTFQ